MEDQNQMFDDKRFRFFFSVHSFVFAKQWEMVRNGFWAIEKEIRKNGQRERKKNKLAQRNVKRSAIKGSKGRQLERVNRIDLRNKKLKSERKSANSWTIALQLKAAFSDAMM